MSASAVRFYFIRDSRWKKPNEISIYLGGRPRDPRVKYATAVNTGKKYPYASKRQNTRDLRRRLRLSEATV